MNNTLSPLIDHFALPPAERTAISAALDGLPERKLEALARALRFEVDGGDGFSFRARHENDLYEFDRPLNTLFSRILAGKHPPECTEGTVQSTFRHDAGHREQQQARLQSNGYLELPRALPADAVAAVKAGLRKYVFKAHDGSHSEARGDQLLDHCEGKGRPLELHSNTFWLEDQNGASRDRAFTRLAFDPYILSTVGRYLGCTPIHVQTNAWFSFPNSTVHSHLSSSAQLFHQDKEFVKFMKVFIYLSDVGATNGPHSYIEGSHVDELFTFGVPFSTRIEDSDIEKYYPRTRIKSFCGEAGAVAFGDTSCVHKGLNVEAGHRIIVQLEYASSLYLSPVLPFDALDRDEARRFGIAPDCMDRVLANYDTLAKQRVAAAARESEAAGRRLVNRIVNRVKRQMMSLRIRSQ